MVRNIFLDRNQFVPKPKRNAYDKSKLVNGTYKAGFIYPIDWEEVTFGDSVKLDLSLALRTMPMVWPIQTPVIAKVYSFYVRYRTLHKNYPDMRFNNKPANFPYIALSPEADFWKTGELGDHLGVPTTFASGHRIINPSPFVPPVVGGAIPRYFTAVRTTLPAAGTLNKETSIVFSLPDPVVSEANTTGACMFFKYPRSVWKGSKIRISQELIHNLPTGQVRIWLTADVPSRGPIVVGYGTITNEGFSVRDGFLEIDPTEINITTFLTLPLDASTTNIYGLDVFFENIEKYYGDTYRNYEFLLGVGVVSSQSALDYISFEHFDYLPSGDNPLDRSWFQVDVGEGVSELYDVANPFAGSNPTIPLCSYLPRAYEMCYRYYFQDLVNEPFVLDGEAQYNRFITDDGDGADTTDYKLFRRNWEADFLTSAKPSPQQGMAPVVGLTADGTITLVNTEGNEYKVQVTTDSDDVINGFNLATQRGESDYSVRRTLLELATSGFTINSLRNVNAYQQWLEANYRRGLKLKDQVLSNFGVNLEYKELDVPEFLGGFSIPLNVDQIAQTSSSVEGSPLGDLAGNGALFGKQKHSITHYCDEEGVVLTLMCITPIPVYSQMLSRCWLKNTPVDFYNPAFGKIGQQPITYEEVCPVQAYNEGKDVHDVFGYQRPWYHMISSTDEVHGLMRTSMSGFLMQRIFGSTPELGASFLHIDESQLNDVFVARNSELVDTYYGQIGIKKYKKTCIPRYALPSLV